MIIRSRRRVFAALAVGVLVLAAVYGLRIGPATSNATYSSWPAVFSEVIGGPTVLVVIAVAAAIGGLPIAVAMNERWPAHLRTRMRIQRWVVTEVLGRSVIVAVAGAVCVLLWGVLLFGWIAPRSPGLVNPGNYGGPAEVAAMVDGSYPLFAAVGRSTPAFVALSALWIGVHAGLIALAAGVAALVVRNRVLALLLPAAVLLVVSLGTELLGRPSASPFIMWMHPGGLLPTELGQSFVPTAVLVVACLAVLAVVVHRSPTLARFS